MADVASALLGKFNELAVTRKGQGMFSEAVVICPCLHETLQATVGLHF